MGKLWYVLDHDAIQRHFGRKSKLFPHNFLALFSSFIANRTEGQQQKQCVINTPKHNAQQVHVLTKIKQEKRRFFLR